MHPDQANILFLFPDQWRSDCLGVAGHPVVRTPFVDSLSHAGVRFSHAYSPSPTCIPARASLLTGQSPSLCGRRGYEDKHPWKFDINFVQSLCDAGFQTFNVGKTHFYPQGAACGFEVNRSYDPQHLDAGFESDYHRWLRETTDGHIEDTASTHSNNTWVPLPWPYAEYLHPTNWTTTTALAELRNRDPSRPFFLQAGFHRPHPPFDPPLHYWELYRDKPLPPVPEGDWSREWENDLPCAEAGVTGKLSPEVQDESRRAYYGSITHVDHQIGRLLYGIQQMGLRDSTWIVFASDHGEMLGDHYRRHKIGPWEGSAGIPLIVRPPAGVPLADRQVCGHPVTLTDLAPTFLEMAAARVPTEMDSLSLLPLISGREGAIDRRKFIHGEHSPGWQFVTDGREKFIWESQSGRRWFFDLTSDPQECTDLGASPAHAGRIALWEARLAKILHAPHRRADGLSDGDRLILGKATRAICHSET